MISFIVHLRKDTEERIKNINLVLPYIKSIAPDCEVIVVEDDSVQNFKYLENEYISYYHIENSGIYNKCKGYNYGLKKSTKDIVCFLDIDCVISKENLDTAVKTALSSNGICIGYNGTCVYFEYSVKNKITSSVNLYDFLDNYVDKSRLSLLYKTKDYTITNTKAVGGCLVGRRDVFDSINGFNPNFLGWGYEDNEIISRARILKVPLFYINTSKPFLYHLPHEENQLKDKSRHNFYDHNHREVTKVEAMTTDELKEYIKTW